MPLTYARSTVVKMPLPSNHMEPHSSSTEVAAAGIQNAVYMESKLLKRRNQGNSLGTKNEVIRDDLSNSIL